MPENGQTSSNLFLSLFCFGPGLHLYKRYRPLHITCLYTGPGRGKREELWSGTQSTHIYSTRFSSQFRNSNHLLLNETDIFKIWSESFEYPPVSLISISRTFSNESVFSHPSVIHVSMASGEPGPGTFAPLLRSRAQSRVGFSVDGRRNPRGQINWIWMVLDLV